MARQKEIGILQTALLLLDGVKESDIILKYDLAPYLNDAKKVVNLLKSM